MSKVISLHHIVFATKYRNSTITESHKKELYNYIWGILKQRECFCHRINGTADHIHLLIDLHPNVALAALVKDIKMSTHNWLRQNANFPIFDCWARGYYAASISRRELLGCKAYISDQEEHHLGRNFDAEIRELMEESGLSYHPNDLI